jgi:hypothetical protein
VHDYFKSHNCIVLREVRRNDSILLSFGQLTSRPCEIKHDSGPAQLFLVSRPLKDSSCRADKDELRSDMFCHIFLDWWNLVSNFNKDLLIFGFIGAKTGQK